MSLLKNYLQLKIVLISLVSIAFICDLRSQPANDDCETATDILNVISDNAFVCISGSNLNALPESIGNQCQIQDFPTVWFRIQTDGSASLINLQVTSNDFSAPTISLFHSINNCADLQPVPLTQNTLYCIVGSNGEAEAIGTVVANNQVYYLAVSSLYSVGGDFEVCVNTVSVASVCAIEKSIVITSRSSGGPLEGPFLPGETVGICMNVNSFTPDGNGCQWFQGLVPTFGNGWDPSSFDIDGMPVNASLNGDPFNPNADGIYGGSVWAWYTDIGYHHPNSFYQIGDLDGNGTVEMCNTLYEADCPDLGGLVGGGGPGPCWDPAGDILPPGWLAWGINGLCPIPGHPSVDYGDGNSCNCCMGPWKFCFELLVRDFPDCIEDVTTMDLTLGFFTFADGETGSWTGGVSICAFDQPAKITLPMCCSEVNEESETLDPICSNGIVEFIIDEPGVEYWYWVVDAGVVTGASAGEGGPGSMIIDTLLNVTNESQVVEYTFNGFSGGNCPVLQKTVTVIVNPGIEVSLDTIVSCTSPATYTIIPNVTGGSGNYEYLWAPGGETTPSITVEHPMNGAEYSVTVTDESGCIGIDSTTFLISLSVNITAPVTEQCLQEGPLTLIATTGGGIEPYLFQWTLPDSTMMFGDTINTTQSGIFMLVVMDAGGCTGIDSVTLTFNTEPEVSIASGSGSFSFCTGDSIVLSSIVTGGEAPYTYTWTTPQETTTEDSLIAMEGGLYTLIVGDNNGCIGDIASVFITENDLPVVDLGPDTLIIEGSTVLDAGPGWVSYSWNNGDTTQTTTVDQTGVYYVCVNDEDGCEGCDTIYVDVITDVLQLNGSEYIRIHPNPNKGNFTITPHLKNATEIRITVMNAIGKIIYSKEETASGDTSIDIDLNNPPEGVYFIQIYCGGDKIIGKLMVVD